MQLDFEVDLSENWLELKQSLISGDCQYRNLDPNTPLMHLTSDRVRMECTPTNEFRHVVRPPYISDDSSETVLVSK